MATYTSELQYKLCKKHLIPIVLSLQNRLDESNSKTELLDWIRKLNDKFDKFQSDVCVTKNVNNLLSSRLIDIERQWWANAQCFKREYLDIISIPSEVKDETLEDRVVGIFDKLGCSIDSDWIETCHRVSKNNSTVIVKLTRRKD